MSQLVFVFNFMKRQWISMPFSLLDLGMNSTHTKGVTFDHLAYNTLKVETLKILNPKWLLFQRAMVCNQYAGILLCLCSSIV